MFSTWYLFCNTISARDSLLHPWFTTLTNKPLKRENLGDPSQTPTAVYLFTYLLILVFIIKKIIISIIV